MLDYQLVRSILKEIDALLKNGVLPVSNDHLKKLSGEVDILQYLIEMKNEGLISGDLIKIGAGGAPHRITNIRLTYMGIRELRQSTDKGALSAGE